MLYRFLPLILLLGCYQKQTITDNNTNLFVTDSLKGIWVSYDSLEFKMIDIQDTDNITYYYYVNKIDYIKEIKKSSVIYKSKATMNLDSIPTIYGIAFSLNTDVFNFEFILRNDSLFEINKTGLGKALVRIKETN